MNLQDLLYLKTKELMSQLKEQDGRYYQECEVVMIATEKETNIGQDILTGNLLYSSERVRYLSGYNLYITSNEVIKKGDWFISAGKIHQYKGDKLPLIVRCDFRKIIATTDETLSLTFNNGKTDLKFVLPKPSNSFISKYIEEYNKGDIITKVLVEYENNYMSNVKDYYKLKVDLDNTITIKKVKDSYSREELRNILLDHSKFLIEELGLNQYPEEMYESVTKEFIQKL